MNACEFTNTPDVELYFYGELDAVERTRVEHHLRGCAECRQRLDDLHAIRRALASQPVVDAPPANDWSGFMRRLDNAVGVGPTESRRSGEAAKADGVSPKPRRGGGGRHIAAIAAMLAIVTLGILMAARFRAATPIQLTQGPRPDVLAPAPNAGAANAKASLRALRENSAEHLERSKLVVLGLVTRDARHTSAADWQYERQLAATLLSDTRLFRLTAQERGAADVARVMRDLETVLLEVSMSDQPDRESLERVQRLITKRDLVSKMQIVAASASMAGL